MSAAVVRAASVRTRDEPSPKPAGRDRPRERLHSLGASALSDVELLTLVLGSGTRASSAGALAARVLGEVGGTAGLARSDVARMMALPGFGRARAAAVVAALELGRRSLKALGAERPQITGPEDAAELLHPRMAHMEHEQSMVLILDRKHRLLREAIVGIGGVAHAPMAPREVYAAALREPGAAAVLVAHNHPSGDPEPSAEDHAITSRLAGAASVVGIEFLDHVVVAARGWTSMRRRGF